MMLIEEILSGGPDMLSGIKFLLQSGRPRQHAERHKKFLLQSGRPRHAERHFRIVHLGFGFAARRAGRSPLEVDRKALLYRTGPVTVRKRSVRVWVVFPLHRGRGLEGPGNRPRHSISTNKLLCCSARFRELLSRREHRLLSSERTGLMLGTGLMLSSERR